MNRMLNDPSMVSLVLMLGITMTAHAQQLGSNAPHILPEGVTVAKGTFFISGGDRFEEYRELAAKHDLVPIQFVGSPTTYQKVLTQVAKDANVGKLHADLEYATVGKKSLKLDLYLPEKIDGPVPLIIHIHGGGWAVGNKKAIPINSGDFVKNGYAIASIQYRLSGEAIFPAAIQDCKAAVRWLRANAKKYNLDPDHFAAWGGSAGGHLVALLGTSTGVQEFEVGENLDVSSKVQAVCDWFGPTDFLQMNAQAKAGAGSGLDHDSPKSPESHFIGGAIRDNKDQCAKANPITYVTKEPVPFLIVHGERDNLVPIGQSKLLEAALNQAGGEVKLIALEKAGHGGPAFSEPGVTKEMMEFFDKNLKKPQVKTTPKK